MKKSASDIVWMDISDVHPYEHNPRKNDDAVDPVAESIQQFGFRSPIIVDADHIIIAGHTRLKAAQKLGLEKVPVIVADDLTPEQVKAYRLADNKTGELSGWDFPMLDEELEAIAEIDMSLLGFVEPQDLDIESYFADPAESKDKAPRIVTCPHCGETFEI